ncbi:ABC transporter ATP-binding protein [Erysipelothrix urinaevulpis]|uniref:ABC transporter ATP-binding protein n=1 Tax=Erysipelothrix urinaevulpis TaxID=2683717 RepID=UPI00135B2ECA|nr:ATP-binding cassette domain-containing protein [Erysipelothrix urinaevulpis]
MIEIREIDKCFKTEYSTLQVYQGLNLKIFPNDFVVIIGANGSGKSTLLNLITHEIEIDKGDILLDKSSIKQIKKHKLYQKIARVHQNPEQGTAPNLTIMENFLLTQNKGKLFNLNSLFSQNQQLFKEQVQTLEMGLEDKFDVKAKQLSGGQRQALALVMASLSQPDVLLLDEHTAALDPKSSKTIMELTQRLVDEMNITTLMVTHNLQHALDYGNRLVMFKEGKVALDLNKEEKDKLSINDLRKLFSEDV